MDQNTMDHHPSSVISHHHPTMDQNTNTGLQSNPNGLEHSPKVNEPENTAPTRQRAQPQPEDTAPMSQNAAPTGQNSVLMGHIGFHFGTALQTNPAYARGQGTCGQAQAVRRQASSH